MDNQNQHQNQNLDQSQAISLNIDEYVVQNFKIALIFAAALVNLYALITMIVLAVSD